MIRITLCGQCGPDQAAVSQALQSSLDAVAIPASVRLGDCMSGCARAATIAFRASGKTAYLFGEISADDLPDVLTFARLYHASPDGNFADARQLGALRLKAIARIPA